ncbi:MAG: methyl-accepting chemotaxis protein [Syntrophomonas sp.]
MSISNEHLYHLQTPIYEADINSFSIMDILTAAAPWFHKLFNGKKVVAVADLEKYRIYCPAVDMDHNLRAGSALIEGSLMKKAILEKKRLVSRTDAKVFGFPYIAMAIPIMDEGSQVVGGLIFCEKVEQQDRLLTIARELSEIGEQVSGLLENLNNSANNLFQSSQELNALSKKSLTKVIQANDSLGLIKDVNTEIKMLGFNAAIESARAGEYGHGFTVVADEMRKLAENSNLSTQKIHEILKETQEITKEVNAQSLVLDNNAKNEASSISEAYGSIQQLQATADQLLQEAEILVSDN